MVDDKCIRSSNGCSNGTYGQNCSLHCNCPESAFQTCNITTGDCTCLPGWKGENCSEECETETCNCDNGASFDSSSGKCVCEAGWKGEFCEKACSNNTFGEGCQQECTCNTTQVCGHVDGSCAQCKPGWTDPPTCETACTNWTFGFDCMFSCSCDRNYSMNCSTEDGHCNCKPGYRGLFCHDKCPVGTYGDDCAFNCTDCKSGVCDHENGSCLCYGKRGHNCTEECPPDRYGVSCSTECNCSDLHGNGTCDPCSGSCHCDPGWTGYGCQIRCPDFVDTCQSAHFYNACDPFHAKVECADGWTGEFCSELCRFGQYGRNCSSECNCTENMDCSPMTGECFCKSGRTGTNCSEVCSYGVYGFNCSMQCQCGTNQPCNASTGDCLCDPGQIYNDSACTVCPNGTHGLGCSMECNCSECHHVNGSCECVHGWNGDVCATAVPVISADDEFNDTYIYIGAVGGVVGAVILFATILLCIFSKRKEQSQGDGERGITELQSVSCGVSSRAYGLEEQPDSVIDGKISQESENIVSTGEYEFTSSDGARDVRDDGKVKEDTKAVSETTCPPSDDEREYEPATEQTNVHEVENVTDKAADDEYYAEVDKETPKVAKSEISNRVSRKMDDEDMDTDDFYDRCDSHDTTALLKSENTYNTFGEFKKKDDSQQDYDVVEHTGTSFKKKKSQDEYNTFAQVRKLNKKADHAAEDGNNRTSDSYDNLDFNSKKDRYLKFETDMYNMPESEKSASVKSNGRFEHLGNSVNESHDEEKSEAYDSSAFETDPADRESEVMYDECPLVDEDANESQSTANQGGDSNNSTEPAQSVSKRGTLQKMESYENYDLFLQDKTGGQDKETPVKDIGRNHTLKTKDRKAVDYEDFKLKI